MYGGQPVKYGGQVWCMFGAWNYMVGNFGLMRSIRVYVWCMELYGRQFCLWRSTRVYGWCMEFYGRQFCCMEINPSSMEVKYVVFLLHGIMW